MADRTGRPSGFRFPFWANLAPSPQRPPAPSQPTILTQRLPFWFRPSQPATQMPRPRPPSPAASPVQPMTSTVARPQSQSPTAPQSQPEMLAATSPPTSQSIPPLLAQPKPAPSQTPSKDSLQMEEQSLDRQIEEPNNQPAQVAEQSLDKQIEEPNNQPAQVAEQRLDKQIEVPNNQPAQVAEQSLDKPTEEPNNQPAQVADSKPSPVVTSSVDIPILYTKSETRPEATEGEKPKDESETKAEPIEDEKAKTESETKAEAIEDEKRKIESETKAEAGEDEKPKTESESRPEATDDEKRKTEAETKPEATEDEKPTTEAETKPGTTEDEKLTMEAETKQEATEGEKPKTESVERKPEATVDEPKKDLETKPEAIEDEKPRTEPKAIPKELEKVQMDEEPKPKRDDDRILDMATSSIAESAKATTTQPATEMTTMGTNVVDDRAVIDPKELTSADSDGKTTETLISPDSNDKITYNETGPSASTSQAAVQKEIQADASTIADELGAGNPKQPGDEHPVSVVDLADTGASISAGPNVVNQNGAVDIHKGNILNKDDEAATEGIDSDGERDTEGRLDHPRSEIFINSNMQSINNSIVLSSSCCERNPGVHLVIFGNSFKAHKADDMNITPVH